MLRTKWMLALAMVVGGLVTALVMRNPSPMAMAQEKDPNAAAKAGDAISAKDISEDQAHAVLMAAINKAKEINVKEDIAVVDAGGNLKAFVRMDGAWLGSIDIAMKKAKTSRYFDMPTGDIGKMSQPGQPLYMIEVSNNGLITFPGGLPIKSGDQIIGAIGASGSTVENDQTIAQAGVGAIK